MGTSRCGFRCTDCETYKSGECPGCKPGSVRVPDCAVAQCARRKGLAHCGECSIFPCEALKGFCSGEAIRQLEVWRADEAMNRPDSRCGLRCTGCGFKTSHGCRGCLETDGNPFHGECPVARCCREKGFVHCGQCPDLPCTLLYEYSCQDYEHGDSPMGGRIARCRVWRIRAEREEI